MVLDQVGIHLGRELDHADGSDRYALQARDTDVPTSAKHRVNGLNLEPATGRGPPGANEKNLLLRISPQVRSYRRELGVAEGWDAARILPLGHHPQQCQGSAALQPEPPDPCKQAARSQGATAAIKQRHPCLPGGGGR